jgi:hypothetical protein
MSMAGHAQKRDKTKCKPVHDKELNVDVYENADCSEGISNGSLISKRKK